MPSSEARIQALRPGEVSNVSPRCPETAEAISLMASPRDGSASPRESASSVSNPCWMCAREAAHLRRSVRGRRQPRSEEMATIHEQGTINGAQPAQGKAADAAGTPRMHPGRAAAAQTTTPRDMVDKAAGIESPKQTPRGAGDPNRKPRPNTDGTPENPNNVMVSYTIYSMDHMEAPYSARAY
ncbi:hypothetical protein CYMTET_11958 [Cymbomonas tetramitiformis]|uniref:Uncharacterized protein n=1 Tax=Cymbomonas tetramitiformis TaxID=36881 RepID=A0AAE0GLN9_9CHLO|nr:hypothetical protein CYMTET_11958 [Cymbomonas tetramitiformis]